MTGQQFVTVYLDSTGASACWLVGYPGVQMLDGRGRPVGSLLPLRRDRPAAKLSPGGRLHLLIHGPSTCNAEVSNRLAVTLPGVPAAVSVAVALRPCRLLLDSYRTG